MNRLHASHLWLPLSAVCMEMCCFYIGLARIASRLGSDLFPFLIVLFCYPVFFLLNFTAPERGGGNLRTIGFAALTGVSTLFPLAIAEIRRPGFMAQDFSRLIFPAVLWAFFCLLGVSPFPTRTEHRHIQFRFQVAALILLLFVLAGIDTVVPVILFFIFAFFALPLARWTDSSSRCIGMIQPVKRRHCILGCVSILTLATALIVSFSPDLARAMMRILAGQGAALLRWIDGNFLPARVAKPVEILLFSSCTIRAPKEGSFSMGVPGGAGMQEDHLLIWVSLLAALMAAAAFLFFAIKGGRKRNSPDRHRGVVFDTSRLKKSLWSLSAILARIRSIFGRLPHSIRNLKFILFRPDAQQLRLSTAPELYRALLHWAENHGAPRTPSQTPLEYLESLCSAYPQRSRELGLITMIYIGVRYGRVAPSPAEFEEAVRAWMRVQAAVQKRSRFALIKNRFVSGQNT